MSIKKFKKLSAIVLAIIMVFSAVPTGVFDIVASAATVTSGITGDCTWTLDGTHLTISGNGDIGGYDGFGTRAAPWGKDIESVTIEQGVTSIGGCAYYNCKSLTSLTIPNSVTSIGREVFYNTAYYNNDDNWTDGVLYIGNHLIKAKNDIINGDYTIRQGAKCIADGAFSGCIGLTSITIPDSVTSIGWGAFSKCINLTKVIVPNSVTSIDGYAFSGCTGLKSLTVSDGVKTIGEGAFKNNTNLTNITIPDSVTNIGSGAFNDTAYYKDNNNWTDGILYIGNHLIEVKKDIINGDYTIRQGTKHVAEFAFFGCTGLTSITIPYSVTSIGYRAFDSCTNLKDVYYTGDLGGWCESEFGDLMYHATKLYINGKLLEGNVTIPDGVTNIGGFAFSGCTGLTSITIPNSVARIGRFAFSGCTGLANITVGNSVTSIGDYAFSGCISLTSITIPNSVTSISYDAFDGCTALATITVDENNRNYSSVDGVLCNKDKSVLIKCPEGKKAEFILFNGVTSIGNYAFMGCEGLTSITISDSVINIGEHAFSDCTGLASVIIGNSVTNIGEYAFDGCTGLTGITIPDSVISVANYAFDDCKIKELTISEGSKKVTREMIVCKDTLEKIIVPDSVTSISDYAFRYCSSLTSIVIPDSVTNIGSLAFFGCKIKELIIADGSKTITPTMVVCEDTLEKVTIPHSITSIGSRLFTGCKNLRTINIPDSVVEIGDYAFSNCTALTSVTLPDGLRAIGSSAFSGCTNLSGINIPKRVKDIGNSAFSKCTNLTEIKVDKDNKKYCSADGVLYNKDKTELISFPAGKAGEFIIPDSVTTVSAAAFSGCTGLTSITIPGSVTSIGGYAFSGCASLTSIVLPSSLKTICDNVFNGCTELTNIVIPNSVTSIGRYALSGCTSLKNVTIPDSVASIGSLAFEGCTGLTSVTIPDSVASIGNSAFSGCTNLKNVTIPDSITWIDIGAFSGCQIKQLIIAEGSKKITQEMVVCKDTLEKVTIPGSVTSIGNKSFAGCKNLRTVVIPESVTRIADDAFDESYLVTIKTTENSAAHKYALENDIDFELIVTVESDDKNIIISTGSGVIPPTGVSLSTEKVENIGEKYETQLKNLGAEKFAAYNIELIKDDAKIQPNGKVTVSIAVPDGMDGAKCKVYCAETDGTLTDMGAVLENGNLTFTTDLLGLYIIAEISVKPGDVNGDGLVGIKDAIAILRYDAKAVMLTDAQLAAADVDGNGRVDLKDAILILQYDAKAINKFPIE